jgi:hypothetical protein
MDIHSSTVQLLANRVKISGTVLFVFLTLGDGAAVVGLVNMDIHLRRNST